MEDKDIIVLAFAFLFSAVLMIVLNIYSKRRDAEIKEIFKEMDYGCGCCRGIGRPPIPATKQCPARTSAAGQQCAGVASSWPRHHRLHQLAFAPRPRSRQFGAALCPIPGLEFDQRRRGLAAGAQQLDHSLWRVIVGHRAGRTGYFLLAPRHHGFARANHGAPNRALHPI